MAALLPRLVAFALLATLAGILGLLTRRLLPGFLLSTLLAALVWVILLLLITHVRLLESPLPV